MNRATIICIATLIAISVNQMAAACSCPQPPNATVAMKGSAAVFTGKVVDVRVDGEDEKKVAIEVSTVWKGKVGKRIEIFTIKYGSLCGYDFKKGGEYLIYCRETKPKDGNAAKLWTNICTRTRPMSKAAEDIKELGKGKKPVK